MQDASLELLELEAILTLDFLFSNLDHLFEVWLYYFDVLPLLIDDTLCPSFTRPKSILQGVDCIFQLLFVND